MCGEIKLTVCVVTFNRAGFIGTTLESILHQVTDECEVLVLDGASTDETENVVACLMQRFPSLRYTKLGVNNGIDQDYDKVVGLAKGKYCWLMTDDDFVKDGAIEAILKALDLDPSLVIVNCETRDFELTKQLQKRWLEFDHDRVYKPKEQDQLLAETGNALRFIGSVVIQRQLWLARDRARYFGTLFVHMGVIFQSPLPGDTVVIASPYISYRMGNAHTFSKRMFETFMVKWPSLVWSLPGSAAAKQKVCSLEPWRNVAEIFLWRGMGFYSLGEYRKWVRPRVTITGSAFAPLLAALIPGFAVNLGMSLYYAISRRPLGAWDAGVVLQLLRESPYRVTRLVVEFCRKRPVRTAWGVRI